MDIKKKQYAKPQLRTIELKAEEVMGAGCKTGLISKPLGVNCTIKFCNVNGS